MDPYSPGFEECDDLRSAFIRNLVLQQLQRSERAPGNFRTETTLIPKRLIRYWHNPSDLPEDVQVCLNSWDSLRENGFEFHMFDDSSASKYIAETYGESERQAFANCSHPAMRSDYFRMCFLLAEGGFYVDADEVLLGDWRNVFHDGNLKVQPLCYDIRAGGMAPADEIWRVDLATNERIFYINNNPIAAPAHHPILRRALTRATSKLLNKEPFREIQSTTGPGNFTAALAAHARHNELAGRPCDFEFLRDWNSIAETRWNLSYRGDSRNWRNVFSR